MYALTQTTPVIPALTVNDSTYARVINVQDNGDIDIELTYWISQMYVIKNNAMTVRLSVRSDSSNSSVQFKSSSAKMIGKQLIDNILMQGQNSKSSATEQNRVLVELKGSGTLAHINKSALLKLKQAALTGVAPVDQSLMSVAYTMINVADAKSNGNIIPLLQRYLVNNDVNDTLVQNESAQTTSLANTKIVGTALKLLTPNVSRQEQRYRTVMHDGVSSAMYLQDNSRVMSTSDALTGLLRMKRSKWNNLNDLTDSMTLPAISKERSIVNLVDQDYVMTPNVKFIDAIEYKTIITVPNHLEDITSNGSAISYYVTFDLMNNIKTLPLESTTKLLDLSSLLNGFYTVSIQPIASVGTVVGDRDDIFVDVDDVATTDVMLYKKILSPVAQLTGDTTFENVGEKHKLDNGHIRISNPTNKSATTIYRVVPVSKMKTFSHKFVDLVVKPQKWQPNKFVSIAAMPSKNGMTIELRGLSLDVIAIELLRRDLTLHEKDYTIVSDNLLITPQLRASAAMTLYDQDLKDSHIYEYSTKLFFRSGTQSIYGSSILEYLPYVNGIDTEISNVVMTGGTKPDVSFSLTTKIVDTGMDNIVSMLKAQNMKDYFGDDILKERDKLQQLIAHSVVRVNLTLGIRENFGIVTDSTFVDSLRQTLNAVAPIDTKNRYRYEVSALLRAPETLFQSFIKEKSDAQTNKKYSFSPAKFQHPITLKYGDIVSSATLEANSGTKSMMYGRIGNIETIDVNFTKPSVQIDQATMMIRDNSTIKIDWTLVGPSSAIDHFVIVSIVNGVREVVGTTHAKFSTNSCTFVHDLHSPHVGNVKYAIIPVLNDYTQLAEVQTNSILVS